jgi:hypothetical protein
MATKLSFPQVRPDYWPLEGGLDLVTPAISIGPGRVIDAQNYEPAIGGGYRRVDGYERFDGRASPTSATYTILPAIVTGAVVAGNTVLGATSGATGIVLAVSAAYLVLARVSGSFAISESLTVASVAQATTTGVQAVNGAVLPSDHADYALMAANDQRALIGIVPGSGPIRGVWVLNDVAYAFRDNAGATAGNMWKATAGGWVQIAFKSQLPFSAAVGQINVGDTITGGTSGATATVVGALLQTGTWTSAGVGMLIITPLAGTFASGEAIKVGAVTKATSTAASSAIMRAPGGQMEFSNYNFTGSANSTKMYGVDGVNPAFEFDGVNYFPIRTGMAVETPAHVICHKGFLFLAFLGSVQYSALSNPYAWTIVLGAGSLDTSTPVSGFLIQGGSSQGSALAIFTAERPFFLYGTSNADFKLVTSNFDVGYIARTAQQVSNNAFGMTARGIQAIATTQAYGDFEYASVSHMIQPLVTRKRGLECASTTVKAKNQYRVFFTDGTALAVGLTGDKVSGILPLNYGRPVRCVCSTTLTTGAEVCYFGSDDGYVYQDNVGTSQDGGAIEAWARLPFNNLGSPQTKKRFRRSILEVVAEGYAQLNISYDFGYGNPNAQPSAPAADSVLTGAGGYWDQFTWDQFTWDAQFVANPSTAIDGSGTNISMLYYSNRAQDSSHTISGVTLLSSQRALSRA